MANVLVVVLDDMNNEFAELLPSAYTRPGTLFTNARTNYALCGPFRTALYSGQLYKDHGNDLNGQPAFLTADNLGAWVNSAGYRTGLFGKWFDGGPHDPAGWDTWRQVLTYGTTGFEVYDGTSTTTPAGIVTDYLAGQLATFAAGPEPWFAVVAFTQPHFPFEPAVPTDVLRGYYVPQPPIDPTVAGAPSWISSQPVLDAGQRNIFAASARAQARELAAVDRSLQAIYAAIDDDTVVLITSDSGIHYGDHRIPTPNFVKWDCYDAVLRVPLFCAGPGFNAGPGVKTGNAYADVDVAATVCEITGAVPTLSHQLGRDLRTLPDGVPTLHQRSAGGIGDPNPNPCDGNAVASPGLGKLMRWNGAAPLDTYELYLPGDPLETVNLAYDPDNLALRNLLEAQLDALLVA